MDKKNEVTVEKFNDCLELDEMYWFIERKPRTKTRENTYLMTMVSRKPRQIVGFDVALDKSPKRIQAIVDGAPPASKYCTDGWLGYNEDMKKITESPEKRCPRCGKTEKQVKKGYNRSGTQRCQCNDCGITYTINPKKRAYPEETRELAIKMFYSGVSGRGVGNVLSMNKSNVYNWIKKTK